jgi:hypothetical protein
MVSRKKAAPAPVEPASVREVRDWASSNGFTVGGKGRLSKEVREAFTSGTGRPIV